MTSSLTIAVSSLAAAVSLSFASEVASAGGDLAAKYVTLQVAGSAFTENRTPIEQGQPLDPGQSVALNPSAEVVLLGTGGRVILEGGLQGGTVQVPASSSVAPHPYLDVLMDFVKTALAYSARGPLESGDAPVELLRIDRPGNKCVIEGVSPKVGAAHASGHDASILDLTTGGAAHVRFDGAYADWPKTLELNEGHEYSAAVNGTAHIVNWRIAVIPNFGEQVRLVQAFAAHNCSDQLLAMALQAPIQSVVRP
jgi:hypothetical protein